MGKISFTTFCLRRLPARVHTLGQSPPVTTKSGGPTSSPAVRSYPIPADGKLSPKWCRGRGWGQSILSSWGIRHAHSPSFHGRRSFALRRHRVPPAASEIRNPDGSIVFAQDDIEVPESWSQVACDVLAQKYFRKAGVPKTLKPVAEEGVPEFLWRKRGRRQRDAPARHSAKQVFDRMAGTWTYWGWKGGYFDSEADARAFYDELCHMLATQKGAPNSPQWFNTGLHWAYGIDGPSQGHYYVDHKIGRLTKSASAYEHPQPHACFIQSVKDDLVNEGGIMDLWTREARLFKYGSGTGTNFSHPARREREAVGRRQILRPDELPQDRRPRRRRHQVGRHHAARRQDGDRRYRPSRYRGLHRLEGDRGAEGRRPGRRLQAGREASQGRAEGLRQLRRLGRRLLRSRRRTRRCAARSRPRARAMIPDNYIERVISFARQGFKDIDFTHLRHRLGFRSLHSRSPARIPTTRVRVTDEFLNAVLEDDDWNLTYRGDGKVAKTAEGARTVGQDFLRRLGLRRSRHPVPHHHQ